MIFYKITIIFRVSAPLNLPMEDNLKMSLLKGALFAAIVLAFSVTHSYASRPPAGGKLFEPQAGAGLIDEHGGTCDAEEYRKALSFEAEDTNRLFNLGTMYLKTNRPQEAVKVFKVVVAKNSRDIEAYNLLGLAYRGCGMKKEAIETWKQSLSIDPYQTLPKRFIEEARGIE